MNILKEKRGSAMPWALFIMALIVIVGAAYISSINNEILIGKNNYNKVTARYIAEAGLNHAISIYSEIEEDTFPIEGSVLGISGTYEVEYNEIDTFTSTGRFNGKVVKIDMVVDEDGRVTSVKERYN